MTHPPQRAALLTPRNDMRTIESHKVNGANDGLTIAVVDEPGSGGACHAYAVVGTGKLGGNPGARLLTAFMQANGGANATAGLVLFQNGPIAEAGVNGITHEALLAILIDRLACFQAGPYACDDNAIAMGHLEAAQNCLQRRTLKRLARGVEGTHTP